MKHWNMRVDELGITWLTLDRAEAAVNTLSSEVLEEFAELLDEVDRSASKGVVITSAKGTGFIAGADIEQFTQVKDYDEGFALIRRGQEVFAKLEKLSKPTLALINGFCLGGGTELSLACRYRVALDDSKVRIGLPEVLLGIHPGWGGLIRMPRLIGAVQAMGLILTGRTVDARRAFKLGIVDATVPKRQLESSVRYFLLQKQSPRKVKLLTRLSNAKFIRPMLAKLMFKQVKKKASEKHYPAPCAAIRQWRDYGVYGEKAYLNEAKSVANLFVTEGAQNLIRVFFLQTKLKGLPQDKSFNPGHVHVVGAGTMGGDIAAYCALKGMKVTLQDTSFERIAPALARAKKLYKKKLKLPHLVEAAMDRLTPDVNGLGIASADLIIEAIFENLEAKQKLFAEAEAKAKSSAVLATNTSSIPLDEINTVLQDPGRLIGIHFFNPVAQMMLVELVTGDKTHAELLEKAVRFVKQLGKLPLPVKSKPGFLINRILMPYLLESVVLIEEGVDKAVIDKAAKDFGMPMGPIELADTVGLDVCLSVATNLSEHLGGNVPKCLQEKVEKGLLGKKSGEGFYRYQKGRVIKDSKQLGKAPDDITDRLIGKMTDEAQACLKEGVVADSDLLDAGMIFGTGFAPFRGGPMHYLESLS